MALADSAPPIEPASPARKPLARGLVLAALAVLLLFVGTEARSLWLEWAQLQGEMAVVRSTAVIGFPNIHPHPSFAVKPDNWFRDEGDFTLLWSGWKDGDGHHWFRVRRGEVDRRRISLPMGRDVLQAIDYPMVEVGGGTIWRKIPSEAHVVGLELPGIAAAYPLQVLAKVCVVNDVIGDRPFLVTFNPMGPQAQSVRVYDPVVDGRRITMGTSGYFHERKPVLYDRWSESLWVEDTGDEGALKAIAGPSKGTRLPQVGRPSLVAWGEWRGQYPKGRLLIGADRSKDAPTY